MVHAYPVNYRIKRQSRYNKVTYSFIYLMFEMKNFELILEYDKK